MVTPVVTGFNENRRRTIRTGRVLTIDKVIAAFRPRTTKRSGLPNLSFITRKPKPLGSKFKCVTDGHGHPSGQQKRPAARSPLAASAWRLALL